MQALDWLAKRHQDLLAVFDELEYTADLIERTRLIGRGAELLKLHTAVSEDVFYPAVRSGNAQAVTDALAEHRAIDLLLDEVVGTPTPANVKTLRSVIERHLADREARLFPVARGLPDSAGDALAQNLARYSQAIEEGSAAAEAP
jgi:hypothetical protein